MRLCLTLPKSWSSLAVSVFTSPLDPYARFFPQSLCALIRRFSPIAPQQHPPLVGPGARFWPFSCTSGEATASLTASLFSRFPVLLCDHFLDVALTPSVLPASCRFAGSRVSSRCPIFVFEARVAFFGSSVTFCRTLPAFFSRASLSYLGYGESFFFRDSFGLPKLVSASP